MNRNTGHGAELVKTERAGERCIYIMGNTILMSTSYGPDLRLAQTCLNRS